MNRWLPATNCWQALNTRAPRLTPASEIQPKIKIHASRDRRRTRGGGVHRKGVGKLVFYSETPARG